MLYLARTFFFHFLSIFLYNKYAQRKQAYVFPICFFLFFFVFPICNHCTVNSASKEKNKKQKPCVSARLKQESKPFTALTQYSLHVKFPGQGVNPSHCSGNIGSLTARPAGNSSFSILNSTLCIRNCCPNKRVFYPWTQQFYFQEAIPKIHQQKY